MRYSYEFKRKCVELYHRGEYPETPDGISEKRFHGQVRKWVRIEEYGIIQSMSRKGNCYDNCIMETFFGRLKNEMYYGYEKDYASFEDFSKAVEEYIDYYNNKRIQAKTKWMPPVQYRIASMCSA